MATTKNDQSTGASSSPLPFAFGGFTIPDRCRRIFITAELEPSNGDPRIQPTGFPDIGPVLYADPAEIDGLICLIESEPSMANRLEEVCMDNKYEGTLKPELKGLPYLKAQTGSEKKPVFRTASTLDGHRFASDFLARERPNSKITPNKRSPNTSRPALTWLRMAPPCRLLEFLTSSRL